MFSLAPHLSCLNDPVLMRDHNAFFIENRHYYIKTPYAAFPIFTYMYRHLFLSCLKYSGFLAMFFGHFYKRKLIFLFALMVDKVLPKQGLLLQERIYSFGSKFFSLRIDFHEMGDKNKYK